MDDNRNDDTILDDLLRLEAYERRVSELARSGLSIEDAVEIAREEIFHND